MNGFIRKSGTAAYLIGGLSLLAGCYRYGEIVDRCYPQRYNWQAQQEVCEALAPQVNNGHVLDQTVWNWHFERGSSNLTLVGINHLQYLIRRRPQPDPCIYIAAAHDILYNSEAPADLYVQARSKLDQSRVESVQKFVSAETAGRGLTFQVLVHDPAEKYLGAGPVQSQISGTTGYNRAFVGSRSAGGGGGGGGGQ